MYLHLQINFKKKHISNPTLTRYVFSVKCMVVCYFNPVENECMSTHISWSQSGLVKTGFNVMKYP